MPAPDKSHALDHIVVVLFENRSLDNVLGHLYGPGDGKTFDGVVGKSLSNPIPALLHPAIGVVHQRGDAVPVASAGPQPHLQGVEREVGAQRGRGLPADDAAAEHVEDERAVHPAGEGADVGQVGDPQAILCGGGEVAFHQVRPTVRAAAGQRRPRALRARDTSQASGFHQPRHGAARDRPAVHTARAAELRVHLAESRTRRSSPGAPC